jgi:hypothetical protein
MNRTRKENTTMPIVIDEPRQPGYPVVKRTALGEEFHGAIVRRITRDVVKDGNPVPKDINNPDGPKRQELVLTLVTMPGTTSPAGIGNDIGIPEPGDIVRVILRGQSFAEWIEAIRNHGTLQVGDVFTQTTDHAQVYSAGGTPEGPKLTTPEQVAAVPRAKTLGIYGPLYLRRADKKETEWVTKAEEVYEATQPRITLDPGPEYPF